MQYFPKRFVSNFQGPFTLTILKLSVAFYKVNQKYFSGTFQFNTDIKVISRAFGFYSRKTATLKIELWLKKSLKNLRSQITKIECF